jgi:hypothetical protein
MYCEPVSFAACSDHDAILYQLCLQQYTYLCRTSKRPALLRVAMSRRCHKKGIRHLCAQST